MYKGEAKGDMVAEKIKIIKKKPKSFQKNKKKYTLKSSQELARPHPLRAQEYKNVHVLRIPETPL